MSPENQRRLEVFQAHRDGKPIESKGTYAGAIWLPNTNPQWQWNKFDYRIKEGFEVKRKVIGFATANDCLSHVGNDVWSVEGPQPITTSPVFPPVSMYPHQADIFVDVDAHTNRVVGVSFKNRD